MVNSKEKRRRKEKDSNVQPFLNEFNLTLTLAKCEVQVNSYSGSMLFYLCGQKMYQ